MKKRKTHTHIQPISETAISEIQELGQMCHGEQDVKKVLNLLVSRIARIMKTDVCSLYLFDAATRTITLKATQGLNPEIVDRLQMKIGEGLVGKTLEWLKPVSVAMGRRSKSFKYFPESGEEKFSSFLSVPLIYNRHPIGVLVVQNIKKVKHSAQAIQLMTTLAIPVVTLIEKAKLLGTFERMAHRSPDANVNLDAWLAEQKKQGLTHVGIGAAPGLALAPVHVMNKNIPFIQAKSVDFNTLPPDVEKMRVLEAFRWVEEEIIEIQKRATKKFGMEEVSIFDAYRMVLESEPFKQQILDEVDAGKSALKAVEAVIERYTEELKIADDDYIRERAYDIQDVGRKITNHLLYGSEAPRSKFTLTTPHILISDFWSISDFVEMDLENTRGILSPTGGASSHIAILAQSLGIPCVLGLGSFADLIHHNDIVLMDGSTGTVALNPNDQAVQVFERENKANEKAQKAYRSFAKKRAVPRGGKRITVGANMGIVAHVHQALDLGAEDIGLYRTEFPFLVRKTLPTEEEQFALYRRILASMHGRPVTIRTLDIGGDKHLPYLNLPKEENPFLGWRSIRISLEREDLFRIQLRAMLRASMFGKLRILFPMISSVEEIVKAKEILADVKKELKAQNVAYASGIPVGIMIEVPAAIWVAEHLAKEVQFFSIGTNDLIQYTIAVDRNNAKVASLFNPLHPAVLRSIEYTAEVTRKYKIELSVCGEMAGKTLAVPLLVGLGIDALSMNASQIAKIKSLISRLNARQAKKLAQECLQMPSATQIRARVQSFFQEQGLQDFLPHVSL